MSIFEHARWKIFNPAQHPLKHDASDFSYLNPRLDGITRLSDAIDYIVAVLYPNYQGTVANPAALPATGDPNDYYIVSDDGDGAAAGYIWSVIDNVGQWVKRYDMDWAAEPILAEAVNRTLPLYVQKYGVDDKDASGVTVAGLYAGQSVYGGASSGTNLTLRANAGDSGGGRTGFVQVDDPFRPAIDSTFDLGTNAIRWATTYTDSLVTGTLTATSGSVTDSSGAISFGDENLSTTGTLASGALTVTGAAAVSTTLTVNSGGSALTLAAGSITSATGAISFNDENLSTTGTLASGNHTVASDLLLATGSITSSSGAISFGDENLSTTGTLAAGAISGTRLDIDNIRVDGNTISSQDLNGAIAINPNGTGLVTIGTSLTVASSITATSGNITASSGSVRGGNIELSANQVAAANANGSVALVPNGTGKVTAGAHTVPSATATYDLGGTGEIWRSVYLGTSITNGTTAITMTDLLTLRSVPYRDAARTQSAQAGDTIFWDGSQWLAGHPDTEINHGEVTGLSDDDHPQYVAKDGRSGGQTVHGGTDASDSLVLESTFHATKGTIKAKSSLVAFTDASYGGGVWSGADVGGTANNFRHVYTKGEFKGFRFENYTVATLPSASAANVGRAVYTSDTKKIYLDTGGTWTLAGVGKYLSDTVWDGSTTTQTFTVSASLADAREAIWQLKDNSNNFETLYTKIEAISATQVRVTTNVALPAGSYRLIGIE
jgi:hypothetical protein